MYKSCILADFYIFHSEKLFQILKKKKKRAEQAMSLTKATETEFSSFYYILDLREILI